MIRRPFPLAPVAAAVSALMTAACGQSDFNRYTSPHVSPCSGQNVQTTGTGCISSTRPNAQQVVDMNNEARRGAETVQERLREIDLSKVKSADDMLDRIGYPEKFTPQGRTDAERTQSIIAELARQRMLAPTPFQASALLVFEETYRNYLRAITNRHTGLSR